MLRLGADVLNRGHCFNAKWSANHPSIKRNLMRPLHCSSRWMALRLRATRRPAAHASDSRTLRRITIPEPIVGPSK